ncbi:MAG: hypothetical protein U9R79_07690 [Armatimonadota bacterium]|nr:hypothetical protein [Armatimonadota bacterium]
MAVDLEAGGAVNAEQVAEAVAQTDALLKAVQPGDPATGGRDVDDLEREARLAQVHGGYVRRDLQQQMQTMFRVYAATRKYANARLREVDLDEAREIRDELKQIREDTERGLKAAIRQAYYRQFESGKRAGWNWRAIDPAEAKFLERLRREEYVFAKRFLHDIELGRCKMPIDQRATLYGNASDEAFWWGFLYGDQSSDRYVRWVMTPELESCPDCLYLSGDIDAETLERHDNPNALPVGGRWGNGVYTAQELTMLGVVPQSGKLRCTTNCKCHLERAERPAGDPQSKLQRKPYQSLAPKPVQERYERKRRRYETKRVKRDTSLVKGILGRVLEDVRKAVMGE